MAESQKSTLSQRRQTQGLYFVWQYLYGISRTGKSTETEQMPGV